MRRVCLVALPHPLRDAGRGRRDRRGGGPVLRESGAAAARGALLPVPLGEGREGQGRAPGRQPRGPAQGRRERPGPRPGGAGAEPADRGRRVLEPRPPDAAPRAGCRTSRWPTSCGGSSWGPPGRAAEGTAAARGESARHGVAAGDALGLAARPGDGPAGRRGRGVGADPRRPLHPRPARSRRPATGAARGPAVVAPAGPLRAASGCRPTPEEVEDFVADPSPDAFERVVDRLLASPRFGERWARHWMDLVRYSDTLGNEADMPDPQRLAVSRLPRPRLQRRPALRSAHPRAPRRRPARRPPACTRRGRQRVGPRHRLLLDERGQALARRPAAGPGRLLRQSPRRDGQDVPGPDRRLRPLPRPQVRPDHARGLLRPLRLPEELPLHPGDAERGRVRRPGRPSWRRSGPRSAGRPARRWRRRPRRSPDT